MLVLVLSGAIPIKVQFSVWIMSTVQFITFFTIQSLKENSSILEPGLYVYIFGTFTGCNLVGDSPKDYVSAIAALWRLLGGETIYWVNSKSKNESFTHPGFKIL